MGVFFKHVARMVNLTSKIRQITVIFVIAWASFCDGQKHLGSETRTQYDRYKLVRMTTTELSGDQSKLYSFLTPRVDFWTSPYTNGTVDFMISPKEYTRVVRHLQHEKIPFKLIMKDVQQAINAQMNDVAPDLNSDSLSERSSTIYRRQSGNIFYDFFQFLMRPFAPRQPSHKVSVSSLGHDGIRPPNRYGRYNNFDDGARRPRKIPNHHKFRKEHNMDWKKYHRLNDIYDYMYYLQQHYPQLVEVIDIGKSIEKRPMLVLKIGSKKFSDKHKIVIEGGIHAREWIAPAATTYIIKQLVERSGDNQDLVDFYDFYILPVANPDGYEYSFRANRLWRKNRRKNPGIGSLLLSLCDGVDLNRNFGYHWSDALTPLHIQSGTQLNCMETYSGPGPYSEPETRNILEFVKSIQPNVVSYIPIHSYGQKILYPWSYTGVRLPDWKEMQAVGKILANAIEESSGAHYAVGSAPRTQYLAAGGADDWARGDMGIKWVFLIELPDTGTFGFLLPANKIVPTGQSIFEGIRALAVTISHTLVY